MLNVWCAVARMVADPEIRYSAAGVAVVNFTVAVDNGVYNGEKQTLFARCVAFEKRAEFISNYGKKGRLCAVSGKWGQRSYEKDGQKQTVYEVQLSELNFLDKSEQPAE